MGSLFAKSKIAPCLTKPQIMTVIVWGVLLQVSILLSQLFVLSQNRRLWPNVI